MTEKEFDQLVTIALMLPGVERAGQDLRAHNIFLITRADDYARARTWTSPTGKEEDFSWWLVSGLEFTWALDALHADYTMICDRAKRRKELFDV